MNLLVIARYIPMPDRGSGELRFFSLLRILCNAHRVTLYTWACAQDVDEDARRRYQSDVVALGVNHQTGGLRSLLQRENFDAVMFEYYYSVGWYLEDVKAWQPDARIIIDTVDLEFRRLALQARFLKPSPAKSLGGVKLDEIEAYAKADLVITVSNEERDILAKELPNIEIMVVANVHVFDASLPDLAIDPNLVFVGNFRFEPNIDAAQYLCGEIWPLVRRQVPAARLRIVGNAPPPGVRALAGDGIEVLGYVPDLRPYLSASRVSVAPLRFGAGVKGKIGEAIAFGLPVVTTSIGIQGMPLVPNRDVLIGDSAASFADAVVKLLRDIHLCDSMRRSAKDHLTDEFGVQAAERRIKQLLERVEQLPPNPRRLHLRWIRKSKYWFEQHLLWLFPKNVG